MERHWPVKSWIEYTVPDLQSRLEQIQNPEPQMEFIDPTLGKEGAVSPAIRQNTAPVLLSSEQKRQVEQLQWDFPLSRGSFGNEDYIAAPTRGNASDFIVGAMEGNHDAATKKENGISYIASRPRARRTVPTLCSPDRMRR